MTTETTPSRRLTAAFNSALLELSGKTTIHKTDILEYKGRVWTLSMERIRYMRDKTQDDRYFILTLFAIARELQKMGIDSPYEEIDLAVGLPPEHFSSLRDKFKSYFCRGQANAVICSGQSLIDSFYYSNFKNGITIIALF